jgi:hypothetical protein
MDPEASINSNMSKLVHDANENMKKLSVSIFRTNFKKEKVLLASDR